jgi:parvulin-like peptidyl-prolyl isomerase
MPDATPDPVATPAPGRGMLWLAIGAGLGLLVAAAGLMREGPPGTGLPEHAVATVNGEVLRLEEFQRAVEALASDRREPLGDAEKRHVLDRLLEEELLVQRGLELGLAKHDRRIRGDIVSAVIQSVVAQADATEPTESEVEAFFAENQDYFTRTGRLFVRSVLVRTKPLRSEDEARARAEEVVSRLRAGETLEVVDAELGDRPVAPVPADYLPAPKLREYLGPTATRAALALEVGEVTEPLRSATGYLVLVLVDRETSRIPTLDSIRGEVRSELRRRSGDRALRSYLDELRDRADVHVSAALP